MNAVISQKMAALPPRVKTALVITADAFWLPMCLICAVALRLGATPWTQGVSPLLLIGLAWITMPVLAAAGLYSTVIRYIDLRVLIRSSVSMALVVVLMYALAVLLQVTALPRSSLLIFGSLAFVYLLCSRLLVHNLLRTHALKRPGKARLRTAIYGAGDAGAQLAQTMAFSREYEAVCFFDDDTRLHGKTVAGLRVQSPAHVVTVVGELDIEQFVVAIPSATVVQKRKLMELLDPTGLPVRMLPGLVELVDGHANVSDIREVDVVDLLGRDAVAPRPDLFARNITDKVVLVTGAGGSIGSELCRQIASQQPKKLLLLDHSEFALYTVDQSLQKLAPQLPRMACLGSVMDSALLSRLLAEEGVQTVYHAAAYKHVPIVESNIQRGVLNNVFGTWSVARAALQQQVETCVLISTDKAVRPTNVMGATKRAAELVFQAAAQRTNSQTVFSMVRFGNVLGSSGSVVPLFKEQIAAGGPITITHRDIIRYFMLIPEAAQLVIQAGAMARGGEVFVLDMGEPVRIADLARSMIHLAGLTERTPEQPDGDIELRFVGLRPGEKLYEELLIGDNVVPSGHERILCARERHIDPALLDKMLESLRQACDANDTEAMLRQIRNLVPEFRAADEVNREVAATLAARQ